VLQQSSDFIFRLVCGSLLILQTGIRSWKIFRENTADIRRYIDHEKQAILMRLSGGAMLLAYLYVFLPDTSNFGFTLPVILRWAGAVLMLTGDLIFLVARLEMGRFWSAEMTIQADHRLIETGIFRFIRHPMYSGFLIFGLGLIFLSANLFGCFYLPVVAVLIFNRLPQEEQMMQEQFGEVYTQYKSRTHALIPGIF
jgi:protein-S-isoprenylcysteine O-methyltransferase Ste14